MPKVDYRALVINPKGYLGFNNDPKAISSYLYQGLFAPAPWQDFGTSSVQTAIDIKYTLESGNLYLKIGQATINNAEQEKESVVLFSGNFEHGLTKETQQERALELQQYLAAWQTDLNSYRELLESKFTDLRKVATVGQLFKLFKLLATDYQLFSNFQAGSISRRLCYAIAFSKLALLILLFKTKEQYKNYLN